MQRGEGDIYYGVTALSPDQRMTNIAIALSMGGRDSMQLDRVGHVISEAPAELAGFVPEKISSGDGKTLLVLRSSNDPYMRLDFSAAAVGIDGTLHPRNMSAAAPIAG